MSKKQYKSFDLNIVKMKQEGEGQKTLGLFSGFASTRSLDRDNDIVLPEAFTSSLADKRERNKKNIKLLFNHSSFEPIGGIPIDNIRITDEGLFFENGFIDLSVQKGAEIFSLMKKNVLDEMSIGFMIKEAEFNDSGVQVIKDLDLFEVSIVTEPANPDALIRDIKNRKEATTFKDFPLAGFDVAWDSDAADKRFREFTKSEDSPSSAYKDGFFFFDRDRQDNFTAYKLPFVDVIDGRRVAVPRAIFSAAARLNQTTGITDEEKASIIRHMNKYYTKMDRPSPFEDDEKAAPLYGKPVDDEKAHEGEDDEDEEKSYTGPLGALCNTKDIENYLKYFGMSNKDARVLISKMKQAFKNDENTEGGQRDVGSSVKGLRDVDFSSDVIKRLKTVESNINLFLQNIEVNDGKSNKHGDSTS